MTFKIKQEVKVVKTFPDFAVTNEAVEETQELTITATNVMAISASGMTLVLFTVQIGEGGIGQTSHEFKYSGTGNPLEEAETSLQEKLLTVLPE